MQPSEDYDYCILGAGIAGLSLADALQEHGYNVLVIEKNEVGSGASGTPGALVNPATGRRATKAWKAEQCYASIEQNLQKVAAFSSTHFHQNNGLLRPALSKEMAQNMREQFNKTDWPDGWCEWQTEQQIKERHPGIQCIDGGLWLPIGITVNAADYLYQYYRYLCTKGIQFKTQCNSKISYSHNTWHVSINDFHITSENLIYAIGLSAVDHPWWFHLPLEAIKGQVARFESPERLVDFGHSISSLGYIAKTGNKKEFVQGSTYEHDFTNLVPDNDGVEYLHKRLARTLPKLAQKAKVMHQWAGVRVTTPDKKPVLGRHPEIENLHIFTALGSKGLLYGKFLAEHYANHLKSGTDLYPEVTATRFD